MVKTINVLFSSRTEQWAEYQVALSKAFDDKGFDYNLSTDIPAQDVDFVVYAPSGPLSDFTPYTRCKAVLGLWAGVETIVGNESLTQPLARMVDPGLTEGMVEWTTGHVLRHHLGLDNYTNNPDRQWNDTPPPLARDRHVGILGLGALGSACARALVALNFQVSGWARTAKEIEGVNCHSGDEGFSQVLATSDILILLLPATSATNNILNATTLARTKSGVVVINPGRGTLIDDEAMVSALKSGRVSAATLDVFREEPLPPENVYWSMPNVCVTPHVASATRAGSAAEVIADNIERVMSGQPLLNAVDRTLGY